VTAHVLNLQLQLTLATFLRALEGKMLKEVSSTVGAVGLGARTGIDPDTDSAGLRVWRVLGSDLYGPVISLGECEASMATYREAIAQSGALGNGAMADRSSQSPTGDVGLDSVDGTLGAQALLQAERKSSRCHCRWSMSKGKEKIGRDGCRKAFDATSLCTP
jgi:hypothetical protein